MTPLASELARLSASEMVNALGVTRAEGLLRRGLELPFRAASRSLGQTLSELDTGLAEHGLPEAAGRALASCRVGLHVSGSSVRDGPCLVLANHPGAYDALALMSAIGRPDLLILAADRRFLRALSQLSLRHLCLVGSGAGERAGALRRCLSWLRRGGAVLHFPAGQIEPDADFEAAGGCWLGAWQPGVPTLLKACARAQGGVLLAGVRGVHSPSAKRALLVRWAERRGVTTLSPLLQLWRGLSDVEARVCLSDGGAASDLTQLAPERQVERLREALLSAIASA